MRALISTIEPIDGGVPSMTKWICKRLSELNIEPVLVWYCPWRNQPKLSVPLYRLFTRSPSGLESTVFGRYSGYGIGAWLPELEFTHYLPTKYWKQLIESCHLHLVVSGNPLAATPFVMHRVPFLAWIATPWEADRKNRITKYSRQRRLVDYSITRPVVSRLEKTILRSKYGSFLTLSSYTLQELRRISGRNIESTMLLPVNSKVFTVNNEKTIPWRVGFSGRYCDPRKNIELLLKATQISAQRGFDIELVLVGDKDPSEIDELLCKYRLEDRVRCYSHMNSEDLSDLVQTFDVFVIPSHQEGLCISALEAMACGVPIVSTYCGGPEEFVITGETGYLVDSIPDALANAIENICTDRNKRKNLSMGALEWVNSHATEQRSTLVFRKYLTDLGRKRGIKALFNEAYP
jgi:glycosyltransferase involved in cell wall biosynthesis